MKNVNIFVDVDLTLIDGDGQLLDGAREGLERMVNADCHLHLWSTNGRDYAIKVAKLHGLSDLFESYSAKPDIIIDDMPSTALEPFTFNVHDEESWPSMAERILTKHVDPN